MRSIAALPITLLIAALLFASPMAVFAAPFEFSATSKKAFDKMVASESQSTASKLTSQYADFQKVQQLTIEWDLRINKLHYQNEENELAVRKRIKDLDAVMVAKLEADVKKAKEKYDPLFKLYDSQKQQQSFIKKLKDKFLTSLFSKQTETTKIGVQIAKQDIKVKENALKNAKAAARKSGNAVKDTLSGIKTVEARMKSAKGTISSLNKQFKTETSILNQAVRREDASGVLSSFTRSNAITKQINEQKQKIYSYEQQIALIIDKANKQLGGH